MRRSAQVVFLAFVLFGCKSTVPCAVDAAEVDFGEAEPGGSARKFVTVTNSSDLDHDITARQLLAPFSVQPLGPLHVQAHSAETFTVQFAPQDNLLHLDDLLIESDGLCDFTIPVRGLGAGLITVSPERLDFALGAGERETKGIAIQSTRRDWTLVLLRWSSPGDAALTLSESSVMVEAASTHSVTVTAASSGSDERGASLLITAPSGQLTVPVTIRPP